MFVLCLFAGAVSNAAYSSDNADTYEEYRCDSNSISRDRENACNNLTTVRDTEGATAVSFSVTCNSTVSLYWEQCTIKFFDRPCMHNHSSHYLYYCHIWQFLQ